MEVHLRLLKALRALEVALLAQISAKIFENAKSYVTCQQYKPDNTKPPCLIQSTKVAAPGEVSLNERMETFLRGKKGELISLWWLTLTLSGNVPVKWW